MGCLVLESAASEAVEGGRRQAVSAAFIAFSNRGPPKREAMRCAGCAENKRRQAPGISRSVSGPNSYGQPPIGMSQRRRGAIAVVYRLARLGTYVVHA